MTIFEFDSLSEFMRSVTADKTEKNKCLSMRALSQQIGVPNSTLHDFCSGKRLPANYNLLHFLEWLRLDNDEEKYFWLLVHLQDIRSLKLKDKLNERRLRLRNIHRNIEDLKKTMSRFQVVTSFQYQCPKNLNFRNLKVLSSISGESEIAYIDQFFSVERGAAATAFILPNKDKSYRLLLQQGMSAEQYTDPQFISEANRSLQLERHSEYFPTIKDFTGSILGKSNVAYGSLYFDRKEMVFVGHEKCLSDGSEKGRTMSLLARPQ